MKHTGGSQTLECIDCGSRLIEGLVCLTCDSINIKEVAPSVVSGKIEIDAVKGTVTIHLENGSYCLDHYPNGVKSFVETEIECLREAKVKATLERANTVLAKGWDRVND